MFEPVQKNYGKQRKIENNLLTLTVDMPSKLILLIDDYEDTSDLVKLTLETSTDWKVLLASNGIEGIAKAE